MNSVLLWKHVFMLFMLLCFLIARRERVHIYQIGVNDTVNGALSTVWFAVNFIRVLPVLLMELGVFLLFALQWPTYCTVRISTRDADTGLSAESSGTCSGFM